MGVIFSAAPFLMAAGLISDGVLVISAFCWCARHAAAIVRHFTAWRRRSASKNLFRDYGICRHICQFGASAAAENHRERVGWM
ncbi:MAG: hypothetical protein V4508_08940 [Pseudomonadota bacterium]